MLSTLFNQPNKSQRSGIYTKCHRKCWCTNIPMALMVILLASHTITTNAVPMENVDGSLHVSSFLQRHHLKESGGQSAQGEVKDATSTEEPQERAPKDQCLLNGVTITGNTVVCKAQVGCRAIQKTGHCCPDYQCDCEKDGKTYLNGEKLVDPDTPCKVCYCQGGEILCSTVTCFQRDDCTPTYIPGRCCPEYDNCPVSNSELSSTTSKDNMELQTSSVKPEIPVAALNPKITIKEITKPIEIRIIDENKAKPTNPKILKSTTTSTTTTATEDPTLTTTTITTINVDSVEATPKTVSADLMNAANGSTNSNLVAPSFIQKLQPVEEISTNESNKMNFKREHSGSGGLNTLSNANPTEIIYTKPEHSSGLHKTVQDLDPDTSGSDNIYHIILTTDGPRYTTTDGPLQGHFVELPTDVQKPINSVNEDNILNAQHSENNTALTLQVEKLVNSINGSITEDVLMTSKDDIEEANNKTLDCAELSHGDVNCTSHNGLHYSEDEEAPSMDANPAYPSLPEDDFSLRDVNFPLSETDDVGEVDLKDQSRSINGAFDVTKKTKHLDESILSSTDDNYANDTISSTTEYSNIETSTQGLTIESTSTTVIPEEESLESAESNSHENGNLNADKLTKKEREPTTPSPKRTNNSVDIDGPLNNASKSETIEDPKLDVESLKIDENQEESVANVDKANTANVLVIKSSLTK